MFLFMCPPTHTEHVSAAPAICPNTGRRERPPQSWVAKGKDAGSGKESEMWRGGGRAVLVGKKLSRVNLITSVTTCPQPHTLHLKHNKHTYNKLPSPLCWHSRCTEFRIRTASFSMNHNTSQSAAWL